MTKGLRVIAVPALAGAVLLAQAGCSRTPAQPREQAFKTPEEAVRALQDAAGSGDMAKVSSFFGPDGRELLDSSDPVTTRRNLEVFTVALAEGWRLVDGAGGKSLVIGNEGWPFPVPVVNAASGWRFDTAAGKEEVLARRIGRNELAAIRASQTYVAAQKLYARRGHDGNPAGIYARTLRSDPGRQNGLFWPDVHGQPRSPLGELMSDAAADRPPSAPSRAAIPFHGYHFKILTAQGRAAAGGEADYLVNGRMSRGFALVAWPAQYDATGIMTFVVNQDGVVYERDRGPDGETTTLYDPDASWAAVR